jgi:hypothetical protein
VLAEGADAGPFGYDRAKPRARGGRLEHRLAADGEADTADPPVFDVRPLPQPGNGCVDVIRAGPPEEVGVAVAAV